MTAGAPTAFQLPVLMPVPFTVSAGADDVFVPNMCISQEILTARADKLSGPWFAQNGVVSKATPTEIDAAKYEPGFTDLIDKSG